MHRILLFFMLGLLLFAGCRKSYVVGEKKIEAVLYDLHLTNALINKERQNGNVISDSIRNNMYASVFHKHNLSKAQFDSSIIWYGYHIDKYVRIYQNLSTRFTNEQNQYEQLVQIEAERIDTAELWKQAPQLAFSNQMFPMIIHFSDTNRIAVRGGDTLALSFNVFGISTKMNYLPRVSLSLHYPDTVDVRRLTICQDSLYTLAMPVIPGKSIDSLSGHFFVRPHHNNFYRVLFDNISLKHISPAKQ